MAYSPIAYTAPHYEDHITWWLKAYEQGTTTPVSMATDATAATLADKFQIGASGFIVTAGGALVIPHLNTYYDLWLFPTATEADNNDTSSAIQLADNIAASDVSNYSSTIFVESYITAGVDKTTTDVSAAFNSAFIAAEAANAKVIAEGGVYRISSTVVVSTHCDLENVQFEWDGGDNRALVIASGSAGSLQTAETPTTVVSPDDYIFDKTIKLGKVKNLDHIVAGGWTSEGTGIHVSTIYNSRISFLDIYGFTKGFLLCPPNAGCVYNEFNMGNIVSCKESLIEAALSKGWTNQNTFHQGRYYIETAEAGGSLLPVVGTVLHKQEIGANFLPNNNVYINPSLEGNYDEVAISATGTQNRWINPRLEAGSTRTSNNALDRYFTSIKFGTTFNAANTFTLSLGEMGGTDTVITTTTPATQDDLTSATNVNSLTYKINNDAALSKWVTATEVGTSVTVTSNRVERVMQLPVTVANAFAYDITLKSVAGSDVVISYTSDGSATDTEIVDALVDAINLNATLNVIMVASNVLDELRLDASTNKGFSYVASTGFQAERNWIRGRSQVGFQYTGDAAQFGIWSGANSVSGTNGTKSNMAYAPDTSTGDTAKKLIFRENAQDNKVIDAGIGLFTVGTSYYRDPNARVIHEDTAYSNFVSHKVGSSTSSESNTAYERVHSKSATVPYLATYDSLESLHGAGYDHRIALFNDKIDIHEEGGQLNPSLSLEAGKLSLNEIIADDGSEQAATIAGVRGANYPGGYMYFAGKYDVTAAWDGGLNALDKDNFNGWWFNDAFWNGGVIRIDDLRICKDSTGKNIRTKAGNEFEFENDGYIALKPVYSGAVQTTAQSPVNGEGIRINNVAGSVAITLPTVASGIALLTTQIFVRDETPTGVNVGILQYDSVTPIMGVSANYSLPSTLAKYEITYVGGTLGWLVTNE